MGHKAANRDSRESAVTNSRKDLEVSEKASRKWSFEELAV